MNQGIIKIAGLVGLAIFIALYVIVSILTGAGNSIGEIGKYGMFACFIFGFFAPRGGLYLMIFLAGYSDLLKRMLILESQITLIDVTYILGMAPMALAGTVLGLTTRKFFIRNITKRDVILFSISTFSLIIGTAIGIIGQEEIGLRSLRLIADYGAFAFILFAVPIAFPNRNELIKLFKVTLWVFVPVAIYGIWQRIFGFSNFELIYLETGLSSESRQIFDIKIRPFSTLNAATSLTMVTAALVIVALICEKGKKLNKFTMTLFICLYSYACFMTFTRVGWVVLLLSVILLFVLRSKLATLMMYLFGLATFISVAFNAETLRDRLPDWQDELLGRSTSVDESQGLRIMTLSDRLIGFENLKIRENWKPFGVKKEGASIAGLSDRYSTTFSHDAFTRFLFRFGYVPLSIVIVLSIISIWWLHRELFQMPKEIRRYAEFGMAGAMGALASLASGGTVFQFPANIFFWMLVSLGVICLYESRDLKIAKFIKSKKEMSVSYKVN